MSPSRDRPSGARSEALRASRGDGVETQRHILRVAGRVFAERGFRRATSKEICELAGTNMAAVNYHFGGKDGLYQQVLVEAHKQVVSLEELNEILASVARPEDKLARLLRGVLGRVLSDDRHWGLLVLAQEVMAPSEHVPVLVRQAIQPKVRIVSELVAALLELPSGHPAVQHAIAFVLLPCIVLIVAPKELRRQVLPALEASSQPVIDDMLRYALAGLAAIRSQHAEKKPAVTPVRKRPHKRATGRRGE